MNTQATPAEAEQKLNRKIELYEAAYKAVKACEEFEGEDAQPFVARIQLQRDLANLHDTKKGWNLGFITADELLEWL